MFSSQLTKPTLKITKQHHDFEHQSQLENRTIEIYPHLSRIHETHSLKLISGLQTYSLGHFPGNLSQFRIYPSFFTEYEKTSTGSHSGNSGDSPESKIKIREYTFLVEERVACVEIEMEESGRGFLKVDYDVPGMKWKMSYKVDMNPMDLRLNFASFIALETSDYEWKSSELKFINQAVYNPSKQDNLTIIEPPGLYDILISESKMINIYSKKNIILEEVYLIDNYDWLLRHRLSFYPVQSETHSLRRIIFPNESKMDLPNAEAYIQVNKKGICSLRAVVIPETPKNGDIVIPIGPSSKVKAKNSLIMRTFDNQVNNFSIVDEFEIQLSNGYSNREVNVHLVEYKDLLKYHIEVKWEILESNVKFVMGNPDDNYVSFHYKLLPKETKKIIFKTKLSPAKLEPPSKMLYQLPILYHYKSNYDPARYSLTKPNSKKYFVGNQPILGGPNFLDQRSEIGWDTTTTTFLPSFGQPAAAGWGSSIPGLGFRQPAASTTGFSFGGSQPQSSSSTTGFSLGPSQPQPASSTTTGFSFGGSQPQTESSTTTGFSFGASQPQPESSTTTGFVFGGSQPANSTTKGFVFGASQPQPASSTTTGFGFGGSQPQSESSTTTGFSGFQPPSESSATTGFGFGNNTNNSTTGFSFGTSQSPPESTTTSGFSFGASQPASSTTGLGFGGQSQLQSNSPQTYKFAHAVKPHTQQPNSTSTSGTLFTFGTTQQEQELDLPYHVPLPDDEEEF